MIEVNVSYSKSDFLRGMKFTHLKKSRSRAVTFITWVAAFIAYATVYVFLIRTPGAFVINDGFNVTIGALVAFLATYFMRDLSLFGDSNFERFYESSPLVKDRFTISIDDDGFNSTSESMQSILKWQAVTEAIETKDDFFFFFGPEQSLFIPTRVFSTDQRAELRHLARELLDPKINSLQ
jgi:hypothetical protein